MDDLGFTNCKTKNLNKSMDEDSGTEQFIAARKVGTPQTRTYCAR